MRAIANFRDKRLSGEQRKRGKAGMCSAMHTSFRADNATLLPLSSQKQKRFGRYLKRHARIHLWAAEGLRNTITFFLNSTLNKAFVIPRFAKYIEGYFSSRWCAL